MFMNTFSSQKLEFVGARRFDGVDVATLAGTTSVREKGCSICRPARILRSQNTTNFREKGRISQRLGKLQ